MLVVNRVVRVTSFRKLLICHHHHTMMEHCRYFVSFFRSEILERYCFFGRIKWKFFSFCSLVGQLSMRLLFLVITGGRKEIDAHDQPPAYRGRAVADVAMKWRRKKEEDKKPALFKQVARNIGRIQEALESSLISQTRRSLELLKTLKEKSIKLTGQSAENQPERVAKLTDWKL